MLSLIADINVRGDSGRYLKQYLELMREHLFAIFTQYRSIFGEDYNVEVGLKTNGEENTSKYSAEAEVLFSQHVLPSFALNVTKHIEETLKSHLASIPLDDRQTRQSLLTQLLYCGQSLARVGCDFTDVVIGAFFDGADAKEEEWVWEMTAAHRQRMTKLLQTAA